ncbi:hypothetical protein CYLTODRAFT_411402 [Cylindrobasidium torrendii FP15055 ss-10]|uniref:C2H2-type domain-containing protein n=1 Tax=Cylindrobasidium torrendii FP15055 ss-10 TaxID=1314674 RepID=A0A0D7B967_9AGAR|nr:hypothetical protein CYLTODRAFT_411402 [Cylindrobasidium torrendii FP15055 ss-10]
MPVRPRATRNAAADAYAAQSSASSKTAIIKCKECTYTRPETRMSDVIRHYKQMHASEERKADMSYTCENDGCGFKSIQRSNVESHVFIHTREQPFHCDPCLVANVNKKNKKTKHSMAEPFDRAAFIHKHAGYFGKIAPPVRQATDEEKLSWVVWPSAKGKSLKAVKQDVPTAKSEKIALTSKKGRKRNALEEDFSDSLQALFGEEDRRVDAHPTSTVTPADSARIALAPSASNIQVRSFVVNAETTITHEMQQGKGIPRRSNIHSRAREGIENASPCKETQSTVDAPLVYNFDSPVGRTVYNARYFAPNNTRTIYDARSSINRKSKYSGSLMDSVLRSDDSNTARPMKPLPTSPFRISPRRSPSPSPVLHRDSFERTKIGGHLDDVEEAVAITSESHNLVVTADGHYIGSKTSIITPATSVVPSSATLHDNLDVEEAAQGLLELASEPSIAPIPPTDTSCPEALSVPSKNNYHDSERVEVALILLQLGCTGGGDLGLNVRAGTPSTVVGAPSPAGTQTSTIAAGSPAVPTDFGDHYDSACPVHCKECEKTAELEAAEKAEKA